MALLRFGPMACRFGPPTPTQWELQLGGVLDVGVSPTALLRRVRARFEAAARPLEPHAQWERSSGVAE